MIRARMSEEEIKAEAESRWENLKVADYDSVEVAGHVYTYESILADTRELAEESNKIEDRALEILASNEFFDFESMLKEAVEKGLSYNLNAAKKAVKDICRPAVEAAHKDGNKFEVSAIQRALKIAVEYLTKATKGLVSLSDDTQDDTQDNTESKADEKTESTESADVAVKAEIEIEDMEAVEEMEMTDEEAYERSRQARAKARFRQASVLWC